MQLFLILMLLMYGGKGGDTLKTLRPVLETFGGEEVKSALKSAEELEGIISAFNGADKESDNSSDGSFGGHSDGHSDGRSDIPSDRPSGGVKDAGRGQSGSSCSVGGKESAQSSVGSEQPSYAQGGYPLDHVAGIADKEILYRLAKYFSSAGAG